MDPSPKLRIEHAGEQDASLILEFIRALAEYEKHLDKVEATEERIRETIFAAEPRAQVIFAYDGENPVGFAVFFYTYSTFAGQPGLYLEDIYVKSEARGKGVGRQLFRYLARRAKEKGCCKMEWAVLRWNKAAIKFYESLGASRVDDWAIYSLRGNSFDRLAAEYPGEPG